MSERDIAVVIGSLRKESFNRKMARAAAALAPAHLELRFVEIGGQPLYNEDLDTESPPPEWLALRDQIRRADAILFVTPEYNRSMPGVLKNAIDIASRPYGKSAFDGKPGAVISVSPGAIGGFGANQHLRQSCVFLNVPMMQQPEAYIGAAAKLFDETGALANEATKEFLRKFMEVFAEWIERNAL